MSERKSKNRKEEKPVTAQPTGDAFLVNPSPSRRGTPPKDGRQADSSWGEGCYRKLPTNTEES